MVERLVYLSAASMVALLVEQRVDYWDRLLVAVTVLMWVDSMAD